MCYACLARTSRVKLIRVHRSNRDDLSSPHRCQEGRDAGHFHLWQQQSRIQHLGAKARLASDHPDIHLDAGIPQGRQPGDAPSLDKAVTAGIRQSGPVEAQGVTSQVGGKQNDLASKRGGAGRHHERVMCSIMRTGQQQHA